jgi:hypothetical protein
MIKETYERKKKQLQITLVFDENDYFENEELSIKVYYEDKDCDLVIKTVGTEIDWKEDMNLTVKKIKKT